MTRSGPLSLSFCRSCFFVASASSLAVLKELTHGGSTSSSHSYIFLAPASKNRKICTIAGINLNDGCVLSGLGDGPAEVPEKKAKEKYIAPHLRACAGNKPEEYTQIRIRLLNRLFESNVESITGELSLIFQILTEEVLASCSSGPRGNQQLRIFALLFYSYLPQ
ncbi:hypothetical protein HKD37_11G031563 [Glycine soja]